MRLREDYPIYLNPTDTELVELASTEWDTLRVVECEGTFLVASGFGNTHETLVQYYKRKNGEGKTKIRNLPDWSSFIFFHDRTGIMLCNLEDVGGSDKATPSRWRRRFGAERLRQLRLIAEHSGLSSI